ncbi:MAG: hypothetical protein QF681_06470 [Vicinamibacterales bacterium]|jgi:hypothetical protein|nr:hypothetical protein [Vicinamibacterales bacterium]
MAETTLQTVAVIAAVTLGGTVTVAVMASGSSEGHEGGFVGHLHALAQQLHGGGGHYDPMAHVVARLHLKPDRPQHLEKINEIVESDDRKH